MTRRVETMTILIITSLLYEGEQIKQLPIIIKPHEDQLMWMHSRDSYSSVKIGYNTIHLWHENKQTRTSYKDSQT
jgi:hypothetical protein